MITELKGGFMTEQATFNGLELSVKKAVPEAMFLNNKELLGGTLNVCVAYCPTYAHGDFSDSKLIEPPLGIVDSRVWPKAQVYALTLEALNSYAKQVGINLNLVAVHANKGVLLKGEPSDSDFGLLNYSNRLYEEFTYNLCSKLNLPYKFLNYDDLNVKFPTFIDMGKKAPIKNLNMKEESAIISSLNDYLDIPVPVEDNGNNRKVIKGILKNNGIDATFWLVAGYLPFDFMIPKLVGENGIYIVSERAHSLFGISKLTKSLDNLTRIQLGV